VRFSGYCPVRLGLSQICAQKFWFFTVGPGRFDDFQDRFSG
jgi:hypothetical protein